MLETEIKSFTALSSKELYGMLRLRSEIFVVEQNCVYLDIDDKDQNALHVLGKENGVIVAYARLFKKGDYFEQASIGRVLVAQAYRNLGYGKAIMEAAINTMGAYYKKAKIKISAQMHLERFYHELGFQQVGEGYLEDGIPHIAMLRDL